MLTLQEEEYIQQYISYGLFLTNIVDTKPVACWRLDTRTARCDNALTIKYKSIKLLSAGTCIYLCDLTCLLGRQLKR